MNAKAQEDIRVALGLPHHAEALFVLPRKILDLRNPISDVTLLQERDAQPMILKLQGVKFFDRKGKQTRAKAFRAQLEFTDRYGKPIRGSCFTPYDWIKATIKTVYGLVGDIREFNGRLQIDNASPVPRHLVNKVSTIYPAERKKLSADKLKEYLDACLVSHFDDACDLLCAKMGMTWSEVRDACGMDPDVLLKRLHTPNSPEELDEALKAAKSLAIRDIVERGERVVNRPPNRKSIIMAEMPSFSAVDSRGQPLTLTGDQSAAVSDILRDFRSGFPMRRLLSGDVGTGKTLSFVIPAVAAHMAGKRVAILTPNEPLVKQIIGQIGRLFPDVPCFSVTSLSKMKKADRDKFNPDHILVGTSALCNLKDYVADFAVIDEQHKFSREQRESFCDSHTHILEASATAIPRSMALVTHSGMDVSYLRESPVEKNIVTRIIDVDQRSDIYKQINESLANNKRVLIVYSAVIGNELATATTVGEGFEVWNSIFPGRVTMAHGKMTSDEKVSAIDQIKSGEKSIMVASSVAEVGLDIPDLEVCVVVRPQNYGLSQLHQLRGRVARNGGDGFMFLYPEEDISDETLERLMVLERTTDGFVIAEQDMEMRGFGDVSDDSDEQTGASLTIFKGIKILPSDLKAASIRSPAP